MVSLCITSNNYDIFYRGSRPVASGKPATNIKTVAFDLPPWQNQPTENGEAKIEVSFLLTVILKLFSDIYCIRY